MRIEVNFVELHILMRCFLDVRFSVEFIEENPVPSSDLVALNQALIDVSAETFENLQDRPFHQNQLSYAEFSMHPAYENLGVAGVAEEDFANAIAPYELVK